MPGISPTHSMTFLAWLEKSVGIKTFSNIFSSKFIMASKIFLIIEYLEQVEYANMIYLPEANIK
jgi:hypothetical protein